jgi:hypothetical protein
MKVRIKKDPRGFWCVEKKEWFNFAWVYVDSFHLDQAKERALKFANELINPEIIEVKK